MGLGGPLLCPSFVDRNEELDQLKLLLQRAERGQPQAALISGEAGVGKSSLCGVLTGHALQRNAVVVTCQASVHDRSLSCAPIIDGLRRAFRGIVSEQNAPPETLKAYGELQSRILDPQTYGMEEQISSFGGAAPLATPAIAAVYRRELFETLAASLDALTRDPGPERHGARPVVLLFEDAHWSDDTSLDFILHLARDLAHDGHGIASPRYLFVIVTYRSGSAREHSMLGHLVSNVTSQRLATHISVNPLGPDAHAELVSATLGQSPSGNLSSLLFEHSDGIPFITEELLGAMAATGHLLWEDGRWSEQPRATLHLPLSLKMAVLDRIRSFSSAGRRALICAALIGRDFTFDTLQRVSGMQEAELIDLLREAVAEHLICERVPLSDQSGARREESYCFRHALTCDVLRDELLARERRIVHGRIAEELTLAAQGRYGVSSHTHLSESVPVSTAADLTYHLSHSGQVDTAKPYALRLAEHSLRVGAFSEAVGYLEVAIAGTQQEDQQRVTLLEQLGMSRLALADRQQGLSDLIAARDLARAAGLTWESASIDVEIGDAMQWIEPGRSWKIREQTLIAAEACYRSAEPKEVNTLRLYAAASLAAALLQRPGTSGHEAALWAERVFTSIAGSTGSEQWLWRAFAGKGLGCTKEGRHSEGLTDMQRAVHVATRSRIPNAVAFTRDLLVAALQDLGDDVAAMSVNELNDGHQNDSESRCVSGHILSWYFAKGRWREGIDLGRKLVERYARLGLPVQRGIALSGMGHLQLALGNVDDSATSFEEASNLLVTGDEWDEGGCVLWGLAKVHSSRGNTSEAAGLYARWREWWSSGGHRLWDVAVLLDAVLFFAEIGDLESASLWAADIKFAARQAPCPIATASALEADGAVALASGRQEDAICHLQTAATSWRDLGRPFDEARALARLGGAYLDSPGREVAGRAAAAAAIDSALRLFVQLSSSREVRRVHELRRRAGLLTPARKRRTALPGQSPLGGLTPRECDVLRLLVAGQTNREIAQSLFIAESTAELHVSRILGKLQCSSRSQAAAMGAVWAARSSDSAAKQRVLHGYSELAYAHAYPTGVDLQ